MKKKLFVWYYKHDNHVCALDEDGKMIYTVISQDPKKTVKVLFTGNAFLLQEYEVKVQDQEKLERHVYDGESRDLIPKDFQAAWDKYKGLEYSPS